MLGIHSLFFKVLTITLRVKAGNSAYLPSAGFSHYPPCVLHCEAKLDKGKHTNNQDDKPWRAAFKSGHLNGGVCANLSIRVDCFPLGSIP